MERDVQALEGHEFDLLVIGGGINGTGVARDAARRGLSVALVEKEDFGYGTTGRSTRLIHGGIRYLEHAEFGLVRESLRERELLFHNAPHLVHPLPFLLPIYEGARTPRWKMKLGLWLYDLLSYDKSVPNHRMLDAEETLRKEPGLKREGLKGAAVYYDAQVSFVERMCVENAADAAEHGAVVTNHVEVQEFRMNEGEVAGVLVRDRLTDRTFEVRARTVVNAAGPWISRLDVRRDADRARMTKGIHLVTPKVTEHAIVLFSPEDNRLFFAVPWLDQSLVGTTDTEFHDDPDDVHATPEDVEYMLESARTWLPGAPLDRIHYTWAGVRSLLKVEGVDEGAIPRRHQILDHGREEGIGGVFSIIGGKITPYRFVAEETVDRVVDHLGLQARTDTHDAPLPGAYPGDRERFVEEVRESCRAAGVDETVAGHLADLYGAQYPRVLALVQEDASLGKRLCEHGPELRAEVVFAAREEMAWTASDVLLRRTTHGLRPCEGRCGLPFVLDVLARERGWTDAARDEAESAYLHEVAGRHRFEDTKPDPANP